MVRGSERVRPPNVTESLSSDGSDTREDDGTSETAVRGISSAHFGCGHPVGHEARCWPEGGGACVTLSSWLATFALNGWPAAMHVRRVSVAVEGLPMSSTARGTGAGAVRWSRAGRQPTS